MWALHPSRPVRFAALGLGSLLLAVACGNNNNGGSSTAEAPADQQVLRVNQGVEANSLDPSQQTYTYEAAVDRRGFEALLPPQSDPSDVQGGAPQGYADSSHGVSHTLHLHPNGELSDRKLATAKDCVY